MSNKKTYSVYCEEEMVDMEVNAYYLSRKGAFRMASELFDEGKEQVTIVNMESYIKEQEENNETH
jgi:hypothetical protein